MGLIILSSLDWVVVGFVWFCFRVGLMEFKLALNLCGSGDGFEQLLLLPLPLPKCWDY